MRFEPACAFGVTVVAFLIDVRRAVELDDQFGFGAEEIGDVGADLCLPAEAKAGELFAAQEPPQLAFGFGHGAAEVAGLGASWRWCTENAWHGLVSHPPSAHTCAA